MKHATVTPKINPKATTRQSSDDCWPLRNSKGETFAEAQELHKQLLPFKPYRLRDSNVYLPSTRRSTSNESRSS